MLGDDEAPQQGLWWKSRSCLKGVLWEDQLLESFLVPGLTKAFPVVKFSPSWTLFKVTFTVRAITHWNNLPRDVSLEVLKTQSDRMLVNDDFMILSPHLRSISPKKAGPDHLWRCLPAWAVLWFWGYWETEEGHFYVTTSMQAITCKHLLIIPSKITWNQPLPERQDPIPWMGIWRPGSKGGMPDPLRVQKPRGSH